MRKFTDSLLTKLTDGNQKQLTKVFGEFSDKVDSEFSLLKGRIKQLEDQPAAPKARASFTVEKGNEGGELSKDPDTQALLKRQNELMVDPNEGTPKERMEIAQALRKAQANGEVIA